MNKTTVTNNAWNAVIATSTTDRILTVISGSGRLCFGPTSGVTIDEGLPVSQGWERVVPGGVDVSAMQSGGAPLVLVDGPFGV